MTALFQQPFSTTTRVIRYQNISVTDFTGAKDDEQSKLISSHLILASIQHDSVRMIVPLGGVSWKQPCSLTGAPLHDDDGNMTGRGGDICSYKTYKAPVKSPPPTNQQPVFCCPTNSVQSTEGKSIIYFTCLLTPSLSGSSNFELTTKGSWLAWGRVDKPLVSALWCQ